MEELHEPITITGQVWDYPWIGAGVSSTVFRISDSAVIKKPFGWDEDGSHAEVERAIYQRLGPHPHITKVLGIHDGMLVLENLQYMLRKRLLNLHKDGQISPTVTEILCWASQVALGFKYIHSRGVFQVDIGAHNVLLDWNENVKLSDFAGSSIDGSEPMVCCSARAQHPDFPATKPSIQTEIFGLGSLLYEIETLRQPYQDKPDNEVERLFRAGKFPDTAGLMLGCVVTRCWLMEYKNVGEVLDDIEDVKKILENAYNRTTKTFPNTKTERIVLIKSYVGCTGNVENV